MKRNKQLRKCKKINIFIYFFHLTSLQNAFAEGDVGNIIRKLENTIFSKRNSDNSDLVDLGEKVYIFPVVRNIYNI